MTLVAPNISQASMRRVTAAVVLGSLTVGAWWASLDRMDGAGMSSRFAVGSLGFFVLLWVLMMAAMMFPSVWPAVAIYGLIVRRRAPGGTRQPGRAATFVAGYLGSWTVYGLLAFGLLAGARTAGLDTLSDTELGRYLVAPVALVGALYQVAPFKQACLRHCRGPLSFFMEHWRDGARGAFLMGARHGLYCVGCCWMLMLVLLAIGVMSITWMAVASVAIAVEKLAPASWARRASGLLTVGLAVLAFVALVRPSWLPGVGGMGGMDDMKSPMG